MGAISKIFATIMTYPYQVIRSRLQNQRDGTTSCPLYRGVLDVIRQTWKYEGLRGYYKGLVPTVVRVTPASCVIFVVYEKLFKWIHYKGIMQ
jgi:solute carrier family 25 folate transporter 32